MQITFEISEERAPAVLAAILQVHPKPTENDTHYVEDETDKQWAQRILQQRFRRTIVSILRKAERHTQENPDPGIPAL